MRLASVILFLLLTTPAAVAEPCGLKIDDWCVEKPGDPCARHPNVQACKADKSCYGLPYRGESLVACQFDERGFGLNCPTVGCTSTPPRRTR